MIAPTVFLIALSATSAMAQPVSPQRTARLAGFFWLMVFVTGSVALALPRGFWLTAVNAVASLCYIAVTVLLYHLLKPVDRRVSMIAMSFGLTGCITSLFQLARFTHVRDLVFFGFHCLLVGVLILKSTFLPRVLGLFMVFAGLGWMTFISPSLSESLAPYNLAPGMIGEGLLILWLLIKGVNVERWHKEARLV